ncbi:hypothetical protein ACLESD_06030 [Pyxidicoccus sp. 3LFB2]
MSLSTKKQWTLEAIQERLARTIPRARMAPELSEARWAFRRAAAVLVSFDPMRLRPDESSALGPEDTAARHLVDDCTVTASSDGTRPARWTLRPEVRRKTLERMRDPRELVRVLEANPEEAEAQEQQMATACIRGRLPPPEQLSERELSCLLDTAFMLEGADARLPDRERVKVLLEQKRLRAQFEYLVGTHFQGRKDELDALRVFVGLLAAEYVSTTIRHVADAFLNGEPSVLVLHGPGGVGKSTLLSKFLLEHTQLPPGQRIPFAYLDFDNPRFTFDEPLELLLEIVRQLGVQSPSHQAITEDVARGIRSHAARMRAGEARAIDPSLLRAFGALLGALTGNGPVSKEPGVEDKAALLLVLDTFEEVQYRSSPQLVRAALFLKEMRLASPKVRVVISGRAPLPNLKVNGRSPRSLALTELDEPAAMEVLLSHGIESPELAGELVKQVGRNPLSLKLAAAVAKREGITKGPIQDLKTTRFLFFSAKETMIQGQLYGRILGHIHDPEVRQLAHPGLVLRQVTPTLIREVLAEPCGLRVDTPEWAQWLFDELSKEVALVSAAGPDRVKHRLDVRSVMLELLMRDRPEQVEAIHRAAVAFYERATSGLMHENRAEELYHRLMLGEDIGTLESRWIADVGELLMGSQREMPPSSQAFLASRLGFSVPEDVSRLAGLEPWEQMIAYQVGALLASQTVAPEQCLAMMRERRERSEGSPLHPLEVKTLMLIGRIDEAGQLLEMEALPSARRAANTRSLLELLLLAGGFHRDHGLQEVAVERLQEASILARKRSDIGAWMQALLRLSEIDAAQIRAERPALYGEIAQVFESPSTSLKVLSAPLIADIVKEVGTVHPGVLFKILDVVGLKKMDVIEDLKVLGGLVEERLRQGAPMTAEIAYFLRLSVELNRAHPLGRILEMQSQGNLEALVLGLLQEWPGDREVRALIARMLSRQFASHNHYMSPTPGAP